MELRDNRKFLNQLIPQRKSVGKKMVLENRGDKRHNAMVGRRIPHPASTKFYDEEVLPPAKRVKTFESTDGEDSTNVSDDEAIPQSPRRFRDEIPDSDEESGSEDDEKLRPQRPTELESALLAVKVDKEAIQEYEAMRAAGNVPEDLKSRVADRTWTKGKTSIYVDAFNLALETVLEDEGHLFDEREMEVFNQWRELSYESQYL